MLSKYTARSNGSFVKLTHFSIGWSYYSCDPEWGSLQASHIVLELENELRAFDVRFVTLKGVVEIVPRKLNKGLLVKKVLRDNAILHDDGLDFVLCMGDDISDEKMFTVRVAAVMCYRDFSLGAKLICLSSLCFRTLPKWATRRTPSLSLPWWASLPMMHK